MKIKCPHCQGVATIDDLGINDKGVKLRCPQCGRRIVIKKKPAALSGQKAPCSKTTGPVSSIQSNETRNDETSPRPTSSRPSERSGTGESEPARLLRRVEQRREARRQQTLGVENKEGADPDIEFEDELADVSVEVTLAVEPQKVIISATVFLVIALGLFWWWSRRIENDMPRYEPPIDQSTRGAGVLYGSKELEALVHRMRLKIRRDDYQAFNPPLDSPEVQVIAEVLKNCGGQCPAFEKAGLAPLETQDGVFAEMSCADGTDYRITYYWSNNSAWINDKQCP